MGRQFGRSSPHPPKWTVTDPSSFFFAVTRAVITEGSTLTLRDSHGMLSLFDSIFLWLHREPPSRWTRSWLSALVSSASISRRQRVRESLKPYAPRWRNQTERRT